MEWREVDQKGLISSSNKGRKKERDRGTDGPCNLSGWNKNETDMARDVAFYAASMMEGVGVVEESSASSYQAAGEE